MRDELRAIQCELNAPKNQYNKFGGYNYRNCEYILEAVKPLLKKYGAELTLTDKIVLIGDRFYVEATAVYTCKDDTVVVTAFAREPDTKKGMDASQITGTASSYARKYALNGLFLIDDNKDPDTDEHHIESEARAERAEAEEETPRIGAQQVELLVGLADEKNVSIQAVCERFGVERVQELTMKEFVKATRMLEATKRRD